VQRPDSTGAAGGGGGAIGRIRINVRRHRADVTGATSRRPPRPASRYQPTSRGGSLARGRATASSLLALEGGAGAARRARRAAAGPCLAPHELVSDVDPRRSPGTGERRLHGVVDGAEGRPAVMARWFFQR
jgi:hypothetical protein